MDKLKKLFYFLVDKLKIIFYFLLVFIFIASFGYGIIKLIRLLFTEVDKEITVSLIVAFLTAILAVLINAIGKRQEKKMKIDFELREKKYQYIKK